MVRKRGFPSQGEIVICEITRVNPNSAFAMLREYGKEGMIHVSEISSGWVRDIKRYVKSGQMVVAKVLRVDERRGHINLSMKRLNKKQKTDKMKEYKLNQRAEKLLELVSKKMKKTLDEGYEEVGFIMQEKFGSLYEAFKTSIQNPELLERRGIPRKWIDTIQEIAKKNIEQKEYTFRAKLILKSYKPLGINIIRGLLKKAQTRNVKITYISAPEYLVKFKTKQAKSGKSVLSQKLDNLVSLAKKEEDVASFEIVD